MIHPKLIHPRSITIVGGSDNPNSPGGKILDNLLSHQFKGDLYVVNPKKENVKNLPTFQDVRQLPDEVDTAIIAIASKYVPDTVKILTEQKNTRGFIIISAGFSDAGGAGKALEQEIVAQIDKYNGSLLGPNNIGLINQHYAGVFTTPVPKLNSMGIDLISGSGATAVFIVEAAMQYGLSFNSIWSVGNSAQIGVEEVLEHLDTTYTQADSRVLMLYIESVQNPSKLLKHSRSLIQKGAKIVAIKAGSSQAGSRAASSHTGALANSDLAVDALFEKAGIIRAYGRNEMINIAGVLSYGLPDKNRMAIVTHAGGPGVMLTDVLEKNGISVPELSGAKAQALLEKLYPGSSVANPIDFLATGTAQHLDDILTALQNDFNEVDAITVIFGSPGLFRVYEVYDVLDKHIKKGGKPIYPVLPSLVNVAEEIAYFQSKSNISFPDEVLFGHAFAKSYAMKTTAPFDEATTDISNLPTVKLDGEKGYLSSNKVQELLSSVGLPLVQEAVFTRESDAVAFAAKLYPVVLKVTGVLHKTDVGGVRLHIDNEAILRKHFAELMQIEGATGVMVQKQLSGTELFVGVKKEGNFGHLILFGMGGIYIETLKDYQTLLAPVSQNEVLKKLEKLKMYPVLRGIRGGKGIDLQQFAVIIIKVSRLTQLYPQIIELDLNPVLATKQGLFVVDARIRIE